MTPTSPQTPPVTAEEWGRRMTCKGMRAALNPTRGDVTSAGVTEEDLVAFEAAVPPINDRYPLGMLAGMLHHFRRWFPAMTVPAAVGWSIVTFTHHTHTSELKAAMQAWADVDLLDRGWLFEQANMSPTDAVALLAAGGEESLDGVRLLAGLLQESHAV